MRTSFLLSVFVFIFSLTGFNSAGENYFGIGPGKVQVNPEPAQGNSLGIVFTPVDKYYISASASDYSVRFDSDRNQVSVVPHDPQITGTFFQSTGTELLDFQPINLNDPAPEPLVSDFYYSMILESRVYGYAWYLNYDWSNFLERLTTLGNQGFRIQNIDTYGYSVFNYGGTWTQDGIGWSWVLNYTNINSFITLLNSWPVNVPRYRPIDFAIHPSGSQLYYGAVAKQDNLAFGWIFNESNQSAFITWINSQYSLSRRLVEIEMYTDGSGTQMYAGISEAAGYAQQVAFNLSLSQFEAQNTQWINAGYRLIDFDKYAVGSTIYYAGIWINDGVGYAWSLDYNNISTFQTNINNYINSGFKPIMVDVYDNEVTSPVLTDQENMLSQFSISQNYPNPFNPVTTIEFTLPESEFVDLKVYDLLGKEISTLISSRLNQGSHSITYDGTNLTSGVYFYRISAGKNQEIKKMILLK